MFGKAMPHIPRMLKDWQNLMVGDPENYPPKTILLGSLGIIHEIKILANP